MGYREVTVLEVKEVLLQWADGASKKLIARQLGVDVKTVRRYARAAEGEGLVAGCGRAALTDEKFAAITIVLDQLTGRPHGEAWALCVEHKARIAQLLGQRLKLTKARKLLIREGIKIPYPTLHRFAVAVLDFGRTAPTIPVADCEPGKELQLDTGWMTLLVPDLFGKRRRLRAWIFTSVRSRHRFVYPCFEETTKSAIEACEAAWDFFGGVFHALIPDNTKAIVQTPDPVSPVIAAGFREYAQARGFGIDAARSKHPKDKARVERSVQPVRDDCFAGEHLHTLDEARAHARRWCTDEYGRKRHTRTQRMPLEHFEAEEKAALLPAPTQPFDIPLWADPVVARDQLAQVAKALYSLPRDYVGHQLRARADSQTVRFYARGQLVKMHTRQPPGGRSIDPADYPKDKTVYATRDVTFLQQQAAKHGEAIGKFAAALLAGPLPWTKMRQVYALLGLTKRYGDERIEQACAQAIAVEMHDVHRLERMVKLALPAAPPVPTVSPNVIPLPRARFLRPPSQFALPLASRDPDNRGEEKP